MGLSGSLLAWYDRQRRELPWRKSRDPYRIWISEIMLQQTRVAVALSYYRIFLDRFPTVRDLAAASVDEVLAAWSGLGYYRRARQLHEAARMIVREGVGFPDTVEGLLRLPGVGPYTAAAVASMAFGVAVPVLDGNVERVLCRFLALEDDPKRQPARGALLERAAELLDPDRPGDSNQALMELGATLCRPRKAECPRCPLRRDCRGRRGGDPERLPVPRARRRREKVELAVAMVRERGRILLFRRAESATLMPGLWELPNALQASAREVEAALGRSYGGQWRLGEARGSIRHAITHRDLALHVFEARVNFPQEVAEGPEAAWVGPEELGSYATSSMLEKVLATFP